MNVTDAQWYEFEIKKLEMFLRWLHEQALSGLPYEVQTSILNTKAVAAVQKSMYEKELTQIKSVTIKKGENDGINDHCNS
jgi:hypothetical protein